MGFAADLKKLCAAAGDKAELVVRRSALDLGGHMVDGSPVGNPDLWAENKGATYMRETYNLFVDAHNADIGKGKGRLRRKSQKALNAEFGNKAGKGYTGGRFKNNWRTAVGGSADNSTIDKPDRAGLTSRVLMDTVVYSWQPGQTIFITNSLPYAKKLEFGHSKQAPAGVVRLAVQNFATAVAKAAREVKGT